VADHAEEIGAGKGIEMSTSPIEVPHQRVLEASRSGDIDGLMTLFADDAVVMPPNDTTLYGKDEIRSWWEEYFQWFQISSSIETDRDVTIAEDQAFHRAVISIVIVPKRGGSQIRDEVRSLTVWRQSGGGDWKISHQIWNSTKPVGSGTSRYMTRYMQKKRP
jgi:ketosteroid isomerase-like protein